MARRIVIVRTHVRRIRRYVRRRNDHFSETFTQGAPPACQRRCGRAQSDGGERPDHSPDAESDPRPVLSCAETVGPGRRPDYRRRSQRPSGGPADRGDGRVINRHGEPVAGARIEIWQAQTHGRYTHSSDRNAAPLDPNFEGYALLTTDSEGKYRFRSIKPGAYREDSGIMRRRTFTSTCWAAATAL